MKRCIATLLTVMMLLPNLVVAQDYTRFRLPEGRRCTVAAQTYQCFDLGEYSDLLRMDEDLRYLTQAHAIDLQRIEALTTASEELRLALDSAQNQIEILTDERERLTTMWQEENRLRHEAENQTDWSWIPWTLTGVLAVSTVILAIIVGVQ
ncbi:MAG TPA: hypothetical protein VIL29_11055 [Pseudothermotoga sp.]